MYNHNKAQQSKNRVHISWDILYMFNVGICYQKRTRKENIQMLFKSAQIHKRFAEAHDVA